MTRRALAAVALSAALALAPAGPARAAPVRLLPVGTFFAPVYVTAPPGDTHRVFVVQRGGMIKVLDDGVPHVFLDLRAVVLCCAGDRGLSSMAFAPDYATSGRVYVFYSARDPLGEVTVAEYRRSATDADAADPASARVVLDIPHDQQGDHNGGQLQFGPEGDLYVAVGDGGPGGDPAGNGQNLTSRDPAVVNGVNHDPLLGKLLRVDPAGGDPYAVPEDNPFPAPAREVFALGLRNPWRFSFDRLTGSLALADVGQDAYEEVDFAPAPDLGRGANYGWSVYEGLHTYPDGDALTAPFPDGFAFPVLERSHAGDGACAVTGGYVVRDPALPELAGEYVYGDYCDAGLRAATLTPDAATGDHALGLSVSHLVSFGEDGCGRVYAVSIAGPVYRLGTTGACAGSFVPFGTPPPAPTPTPTPTPTRTPTAAPPAIAIADAAAREGDRGTRALRFPVTLSAASASAVAVDYATAHGTARAGRDFTPASGRLVFAPGETRREIRVAVHGDRLAERTERLGVLLSNPSVGATVADGSATGAIRDDDALLGRLRARRSAVLAFRIRVGAPGRATWRFAVRPAGAAAAVPLATRVRRVPRRGETHAVLRIRSLRRPVTVRATLAYAATTGRRGTRTLTVRLPAP